MKELAQACLRGMLRVVEERCSRPISLSSSRHVRLSSFSSLSATPATSCTTHLQKSLQSPYPCEHHGGPLSGLLVNSLSCVGQDWGMAVMKPSSGCMKH